MVKIQAVDSSFIFSPYVIIFAAVVVKQRLFFVHIALVYQFFSIFKDYFIKIAQKSANFTAIITIAFLHKIE